MYIKHTHLVYVFIFEFRECSIGIYVYVYVCITPNIIIPSSKVDITFWIWFLNYDMQNTVVLDMIICTLKVNNNYMDWLCRYYCYSAMNYDVCYCTLTYNVLPLRNRYAFVRYSTLYKRDNSLVKRIDSVYLAMILGDS